MSPFVWLLIICRFQKTFAQIRDPVMAPDDDRNQMSDLVLKLMKEIILNGRQKVQSLDKIRHATEVTAAFEIGYITQTIHENYRRMIDNWHSTMLMPYGYYIMELTLYLEEIEHFYWSISHLCKMLHEVERKYRVKSGLYDEYNEWDKLELETSTYPGPPRDIFAVTRRRKWKKFKMKKFLANHLAKTTTKRKKKYFPFNYGWEFDEWNSDT